jgi:hypothetical protein
MSHQIIEQDPTSHDAIHDLESFWWIIVHLALIRAGPGQRRTIEPSSNLEKVISKYFDGGISQLSDSKGKIFAEFDDAKKRLEKDLLDHFHPYFEPIKGLVRDWWVILKSAFQFKGYEHANIHEFVRNLLEKEIQTLSTQTKTREVIELIQKEDSRRKTYHSNTRDAIKDQACVSFHTVSPIAAEKVNPPKVASRPEPTSPTPSGGIRKKPKC